MPCLNPPNQCLKKSFLVFTMLLTLFVSPGTAQSKTEILSNKNIIELFKAGLGSDIIILTIDNSECKFDVGTSGLIALKKEKIPDNVIQAMIKKTNPAKPIAEPTVAPKVESEKPMVELVNHVYVYNKVSGETKPLEKSVAGLRTKQGLISGAVLLEVDGAKSPVRLSPTETGSFIISTEGAPPPDLLLYKLRIVKNKREVTSTKVTMTGAKPTDDVIHVNISKIKDGVYELRPGKALVKGEYFFSAPNKGASSADAFAFGVD